MNDSGIRPRHTPGQETFGLLSVASAKCLLRQPGGKHGGYLPSNRPMVSFTVSYRWLYCHFWKKGKTPETDEHRKKRASQAVHELRSPKN